MNISITRLNDREEFWNEILFLAKDNTRVVGYCKLKITKNNIGNTDTYVVPEYRHQGIGYKLKKFVLSYGFCKLNLKGFATAVYRKNYASIGNLYKAGYKPIKRYSNKKAIRFHIWKWEYFRKYRRNK